MGAWRGACVREWWSDWAIVTIVIGLATSALVGFELDARHTEAETSLQSFDAQARFLAGESRGALARREAEFEAARLTTRIMWQNALLANMSSEAVDRFGDEFTSVSTGYKSRHGMSLAFAVLLPDRDRARFEAVFREVLRVRNFTGPATAFGVYALSSTGAPARAPQTNVYVPLIATEAPRLRQELALLDMLSVPSRKELIERAWATGRTAMSPQLSLLSTGATSPEIFMYTPIDACTGAVSQPHRPSPCDGDGREVIEGTQLQMTSPSDATEAANSTILGFQIGFFFVDTEICMAALRMVPEDVRNTLRLCVGFRDDGVEWCSDGNNQLIEDAIHSYHDEPFTIHGTQWAVTVQALPDWNGRFSSSRRVVGMIGFALVSILLAALARANVKQRKHAERIRSLQAGEEARRQADAEREALFRYLRTTSELQHAIT